MADLADILFTHLKARQELDLADERAPLGVHFGGITYAPRVVVRSDEELRAVAEEDARRVEAYHASPEGQAERARLARIEEQRVAVQRAFGWPA